MNHLYTERNIELSDNIVDEASPSGDGLGEFTVAFVGGLGMLLLLTLCTYLAFAGLAYLFHTL